MAKPSNVDLIAERRAIGELLAEFPGANNTEKLEAYQIETTKRIESLVAKNRLLTDELSKVSRQTADQQSPLAGWHPDTNGAVTVALDAPVAEPGLVPSTRYPLDAAQYPDPRTYRAPVLAGPQMSAIEGDLTPSFVRWFMSQNGPDATRAKYGERIPLLPEDVRRVLA